MKDNTIKRFFPSSGKPEKQSDVKHRKQHFIIYRWYLYLLKMSLRCCFCFKLNEVLIMYQFSCYQEYLPAILSITKWKFCWVFLKVVYMRYLLASNASDRLGRTFLWTVCLLYSLAVRWRNRAVHSFLLVLQQPYTFASPTFNPRYLFYLV